MKRSGDGIPNKVLRDIFPKGLIRRSLATEELYTDLKKKILSRKLKNRCKYSYVPKGDFSVEEGRINNL